MVVMTYVKQKCYCPCHSRLGDAAELRQWGRPGSARVVEAEEANEPTGVSVHDYIACISACEGCRRFHAAVLTAPPPPSEWVDPPIQPPQPPPASGCEGEGSE